MLNAVFTPEKSKMGLPLVVGFGFDICVTLTPD